MDFFIQKLTKFKSYANVFHIKQRDVNNAANVQGKMWIGSLSYDEGEWMKKIEEENEWVWMESIFGEQLLCYSVVIVSNFLRSFDYNFSMIKCRHNFLVSFDSLKCILLNDTKIHPD